MARSNDRRGAAALLGAIIFGLAACGGSDTSPAQDQGQAKARKSVEAEPLQCDLEYAARAFEGCKICHSTEKGAPHGAGPNLHGVVGRQTGSIAGFAFSSDLRESDETWTIERLDKFLENPREMFPRNTMAFAGVGDAEQRRAIVCYLQSQQ